MKNIISMIKRRLRSQAGFTLMEITLAMAVGSFVMGGVLTVYTQLFEVTATNSNYMAAFRQVQNGGDWITHDALMCQGVYQMASATLTSDVSPGDAEITVDDIASFPPSGIICIEDELVQYTDVDYGNDKFTGCTWESDAGDPDGLLDVTVFVHLEWTDWDGNQHMAAYNLRENGELVRSRLEHLVTEPDPYVWILQSSTIVAKAIVAAETTSTWNPTEKELDLQITANVGGYVLGRHGIQSYAATRDYKVHPRPLN